MQRQKKRASLAFLATYFLPNMELMDGIEPSTSPLPRVCSTPELHEPKTHQLERAAGIEPAPSAWKAEVLPLNYARVTAARITSRRTPNDRQCPLPAFIPQHRPKPMLLKSGGERRIRTFEAYAADLQSAPFGHSGISPALAAHYASLQNTVKLDIT